MNDDARKPLVLVVEDTEDWRQLLRLLLEPLDCRLEMCETLDEAFEFADAHDAESTDPIDLVILDMRVPGEPGKTADDVGGIKYLKRYKYFRPNAPIVVFTAYDSYDACVQAINEGANYYLPKSGEGVDNSQKLLEICKDVLTTPKDLAEEPRKPLVLVVEDDLVWGEKLRQLLEPLNSRLEICATLKEAFDFADAHDVESSDPIDLVILDMRVPDKPGEGEDVAGGIKYLRHYDYLGRNSPIIVLTAYRSYAEALEHGVQYYLPKSEVDMDTILAKCNELLTKPKEEPNRQQPDTPNDAWFVRNHEEVRKRHAGKWAAFLPGSETFGVEPSASVDELDGVKILVADNYNEVRRCIVRDSTLLRLCPHIVHIEGDME